MLAEASVNIAVEMPWQLANESKHCLTVSISVDKMIIIDLYKIMNAKKVKQDVDFLTSGSAIVHVDMSAFVPVVGGGSGGSAYLVPIPFNLQQEIERLKAKG